ncbi:leucyl-tRNA synthetase [Calycina marina]|uniref:leucine--tRNA ligase n=1 Tax=Calycina marina TaxID=1763456 RepID=A0A9P7Z717_9HELO|nr:leucyl-tRNA synthetase [Calycina marina]
MLLSIGRWSSRVLTTKAWRPVCVARAVLYRHISRHSFQNNQDLDVPPQTAQHTSAQDVGILDLPALDSKWQREWQTGSPSWQGEGMPMKYHSTPDKMYILPMFPYPSGDLHLGHLRVYTISDVLSRFRRLQGYQVVHPIGWDAFGLPAENAAIERGINPAVWTKQNIQKMKKQLEAMNGAWDWDREFATCDPAFYKHTQRLFLLLHEKGLAYQSEAMVNYDPVDKTVLANEQVDANGCSWRSGAKVEKKLLKQWFFKISEFREELLKDLELLSEGGAWPDNVLTMQKHWIGKSTGARIKFEISSWGDYDINIGHRYYDFNHDLEVFTTRPDTLHGVQYIALAPNHPIVLEVAKDQPELQFFLKSIPNLPTDSKAGHEIKFSWARNPLHREASCEKAKNERLPIFVAPYVLGDYGEGAVMGVPGHDIRDYDFWKHNRPADPIKTVVEPLKSGAPVTVPFIHKGKLTSACGDIAGMESDKASTVLLDYLQTVNLGAQAETWRLRDWLISRQRYWGTPIPIIHCASCGPVAVPGDQLPVELPDVNQHWAEGRSGNPLESAHDWIKTKCPKCHSPAKRDTDTMDTFVDSSWYFMRFIDARNDEELFSPKLAEEMLPVDLYVGGIEHAILHLLYARFISKFVARSKLWRSKNNGEPFKRVLTQGMVHGQTYSDPVTGRFLKPGEVDVSVPSRPVMISNGATPQISFEKMSKSKCNGVDPGACIAKYGADATRAHILFQAPVGDVLEWDESKISGVTRWLRKIYKLIQHRQDVFEATGDSLYYQHSNFQPVLHQLAQWDRSLRAKIVTGYSPVDNTGQWLTMALTEKGVSGQSFVTSPLNQRQNQRLWQQVQKTIISVTQSYGETASLNTVVSDLMSMTKAIMEHSSLYTPDSVDRSTLRVSWEALKVLVQMMAPITPAFSEECWMLLHRNFKPPNQNRQWKSDDMGKIYSEYNYMFDPTTIHNIEDQTAEEKKPARVKSIFTFSFPTYDGSLEAFAKGATTTSKTCAVQVNGKLRFAIDLEFPVDLEGEELKEWLVKTLPDTELGTEKLTGRWGIENASKIIVVGGGRTVNLVIPAS